MPAKIQKRGDRYRVVEPDGMLVRAKKKGGGSGQPVDGGGHRSKQKAVAQVGAVNTPKSKKRS